MNDTKQQNCENADSESRQVEQIVMSDYWIDVKEQLPHTGQIVLVWNIRHQAFFQAQYRNKFIVKGGYQGEITHWMPLEPPKA